MYIAIIADDKKKELMAQFCIAYCGILAKHHVCATNVTGKYIHDATGIDVEFLMPGQGGTQQIASRIAYDEIDALFFFRDGEKVGYESDEEILHLCDIHNVPCATNIATAEVLILAMNSGLIDWRNYMNPNSEYNKKKQEKTSELNKKKK